MHNCPDTKVAKGMTVTDIRVGRVPTGVQLTCDDAMRAARWLTFKDPNATIVTHGDAELFLPSGKGGWVGKTLRRDYRFYATPDGPSPQVMRFTIRIKDPGAAPRQATYAGHGFSVKMSLGVDSIRRFSTAGKGTLRGKLVAPPKVPGVMAEFGRSGWYRTNRGEDWFQPTKHRLVYAGGYGEAVMTLHRT